MIEPCGTPLHFLILLLEIVKNTGESRVLVMAWQKGARTQA